MSNRTAELAPLRGARNLIRQMRYNEFSRQALGILLVAVLGWFGSPLPAAFWVGFGVAVLGLVIRMFASGYIVKNKELATRGPYSLVRHPLYTGNILVLIGMSLASGLWWAWLLGFLFLWFYYPPAIEYEDRKLRRIFGNQWENWNARVPALMPRSMALGQLASGGWSFAKSLRQNAEPLVVAWVLFWLNWLWRQLPQ